MSPASSLPFLQETQNRPRNHLTRTICQCRLQRTLILSKNPGARHRFFRSCGCEDGRKRFLTLLISLTDDRLVAHLDRALVSIDDELGILTVVSGNLSPFSSPEIMT